MPISIETLSGSITVRDGAMAPQTVDQLKPLIAKFFEELRRQEKQAKADTQVGPEQGHGE
jgi:hypothetical protein